jgi:uncharacterized membrane protein YebE (DUF533 family)
VILEDDDADHGTETSGQSSGLAAMIAERGTARRAVRVATSTGPTHGLGDMAQSLLNSDEAVSPRPRRRASPPSRPRPSAQPHHSSRPARRG